MMKKVGIQAFRAPKGVTARFFGIMNEINKRASLPTVKGCSISEEAPAVTVTTSRPWSSFAEPVEFQFRVDNWYEETRLFNEHDSDMRQAYLYMCNAAYYGVGVYLARSLAWAVCNALNGYKRYDWETYFEVDVGDIPPGECCQVVWNGEPVFLRRLTNKEKEETESLPTSTQLDSGSSVVLHDAGKTHLLVCSAKCTHLGCIPVPYIGLYKGWVCLCHGSVYDKFGQVRQGPAMLNLPMINSSLYNHILCIEKIKYTRMPASKEAFRH